MTPELPPLRHGPTTDASWDNPPTKHVTLASVQARERIFQSRIAELEAALSDCINLAEWWINHKREPGMCERDYRTWLALGHHSEGLLRAKAAIDAAREAKP